MLERPYLIYDAHRIKSQDRLCSYSYSADFDVVFGLAGRR